MAVDAMYARSFVSLRTANSENGNIPTKKESFVL